jgi:hypothetical protein
MKIDEASKLMEYLLALSEPLNNATELTKSINDPEEAKEVRRRLAGIMSSVYEAMLPIIREYPELDPDK